MKDRAIYEYAVIRLVPKVEREEFINIGAILYCRKHKFLEMMYRLNLDRILAFDSTVDIDMVRSHLDSWLKICRGGADGGPIGLLERHIRFRWITAPKSTIIQCSKVHPGRCIDPESVLKDLFHKNVM
jgi:hypothetical protein